MRGVSSSARSTDQTHWPTATDVHPVALMVARAARSLDVPPFLSKQHLQAPELTPGAPESTDLTLLDVLKDQTQQIGLEESRTEQRLLDRRVRTSDPSGTRNFVVV